MVVGVSVLRVANFAKDGSIFCSGGSSVEEMAGHISHTRISMREPADLSRGADGGGGEKKIFKSIEKTAFMLAYRGILWYTYFCGGVKTIV